MVHYLIEFRFHGKAKYEIKRLVYEISRKFKLRTETAVFGLLFAVGHVNFLSKTNRKIICTPSPSCCQEGFGIASPGNNTPL